MPQDVVELAPRVRRAIEGPKPLAATDPDYLTDEQVGTLAADAIGDLILYTVGRWPHKLIGSNGPPATEWEVDPGLDTEAGEDSLVAAQAALNFYFHDFREKKTSEDMANEGQSWSYTLSARMLQDQFKMLRDQRDMALQSLEGKYPVMARAASLYHMLDRQTDAILQAYTGRTSDVEGGLGGGFEGDPMTFRG